MRRGRIVDSRRVSLIGEPADQLTLRMALKIRANAQWSVQRKLRREILRAYDENGINLPYPQGRIHAVVGGPETNGS